MVEHEQVKPLGPAADRQDEENAQKLRRRKCIKCCGIITASLLVQLVVVLVLIFTIFRVKDPIIKMNGVTIARLELSNGTTIPKPGVNMSLIADVSVKNPNYASFKYSNTTTTLYFHGEVVGEAHGPPGRAKARRTMRMNISVDIIPDRLMSSPNLSADLGAGLLPMTSYSRIPGRVKMLKIINRHVIVKMNCSMAFNISSQTIQTQKCKRKVQL